MRLYRLRAVRLFASFTLVFLFFHILRSYHEEPRLWQHNRHAPPPACPESPLLNDVLVVVRTGATEVLEKLPVHFSTVLACVPDYIIYSDLEEDIDGHHVVDVLDRVAGNIRMNVPEFWLYNRLRASGREQLEYKTLFGSGPAGALDNPGWKLDKWKFLPMVSRALEHRPNAKWFVFIEPDTYLLWQNMLSYLSEFDATKPYYLGKYMWIGKVLFGHGGSGFMISNPAMRMVSKHWTENQDWFDEYTAKEWAGDMILGKAMENIGVHLVSASPHVQIDSLSTVQWTNNRHDKPDWCYSSVTFHHMTSPDISSLWKFENDWIQHSAANTGPRLRDIFESLILPRLQSEVTSWDNQCKGTEYSNEAFEALSAEDKATITQAERDAQASFENCKIACESKPACLQLFYMPGRCFLSNELRLGHAVDSRCMEYSHEEDRCIRMRDGGDLEVTSENTIPAKSGWIMSRIAEAMEEMDNKCGTLKENDWATES
ncbi:glycosyltransferase family 31 protein [Xylaria arbuscula]|nr:glycosyltransferase family 31 protein [Xylaria arbuscula]